MANDDNPTNVSLAETYADLLTVKQLAAVEERTPATEQDFLEALHRLSNGRFRKPLPAPQWSALQPAILEALRSRGVPDGEPAHRREFQRVIQSALCLIIPTLPLETMSPDQAHQEVLRELNRLFPEDLLGPHWRRRLRKSKSTGVVPEVLTCDHPPEPDPEVLSSLSAKQRKRAAAPRVPGSRRQRARRAHILLMMYAIGSRASGDDRDSDQDIPDPFQGERLEFLISCAHEVGLKRAEADARLVFAAEIQCLKEEATRQGLNFNAAKTRACRARTKLSKAPTLSRHLSR